MTTIILLILIGVAVGVATRYAYLYAELKERNRYTNQMLIANKNILYAMKDAIEKEQEVADIVRKLDYAKTENDINAVYLELVTSMRQQEDSSSS